MVELLRPEVEPDDLLSQLIDTDEDSGNVQYGLLELPSPSPPQTVSGITSNSDFPAREASWRAGLDFEGLQHAWGSQVIPPQLRIIFASKISNKTDCVHFDITTRSWLQRSLHISPLFFNGIYFTRRGATGHIGNALFSQSGPFKQASVLCRHCFIFVHYSDVTDSLPFQDGFYPFRSGSVSPQSHLWFWHDLRSKTSTYFIVMCPERSKQRILDMAFSTCSGRLLEPLSVDTILACDYATLSAGDIVRARDDLLQYERFKIMGTPDIDTARAVEHLHDLSRRWHIHLGEFTVFDDRLRYLLNISLKIPRDNQSQREMDESIMYLLSRNKIWKLWVENYNERTRTRINLFFNLASQSDSRTNLEIAKLTSDIAIDTQKDSSSMITIAALTMLFLPGIFVSAVFSMAFFNVDIESDGRQTLTVSPR